MPLLEAFPQATQTMKYKLVTLPRGTAKIPILDIGYSSIILKQGASLAITPQTLNYLGGNTLTKQQVILLLFQTLDCSHTFPRCRN
jgi:hypothetical protein